MKAIFELTEKEFVVATYSNEEGKSITKTINIEDFIKIVHGNVYQATSTLKMLGTSNLSKFLAFGGDKKEFRCIKVIPATEWAITYIKTPMIIKLPTLIFMANDKGNLKVVACKKKKPTLEDDCYKFDFPNMLGDNSVCFGSFVRRKITLDEVENYIYEYMATPYSHTWTDSSKGGKYTIKKEHLLGKIADVLK